MKRERPEFRTVFGLALALVEYGSMYVYWTNDQQAPGESSIQGGTVSCFRPLTPKEREALCVFTGIRIYCPKGVAKDAIEFQPVEVIVSQLREPFFRKRGWPKAPVADWSGTTDDLMGLLHEIGVDIFFDCLSPALRMYFQGFTGGVVPFLHDCARRKKRDDKMRALGVQIRQLTGRDKARRALDLVHAFERANGDIGLAAFVGGLVNKPKGVRREKA